MARAYHLQPSAAPVTHDGGASWIGESGGILGSQEVGMAAEMGFCEACGAEVPTMQLGYDDAGRRACPTCAAQPIEIPAETNEHFDTSTAQVLAVIALMIACLPGGVIAIWLARRADNKAMAGDVDAGRQMLRISYIISAVSLVLGLPATIMYIYSTL